MRRVAALGVATLLAGCGATPEPDAPLRMLEARAVHTATGLGDGRVLLAGGCATAGCSTATRATELFDGRRFVAGPRLATARDGHTASPLPGGGVLLAGGFEREGAAPPLHRGGPGRRGPAGGEDARGEGRACGSGRAGSAVLVAGGLGADGLLRSAEVYDDDGWRAVAPMRRARGGATAVTLRDDEHGSELRSAEVFDGRRWRPAGRMAAARYKITDAVARLRDGRVLVAGGGAPEVEVFDPAANRFTTLRSTSPGHLFATATALPDGRALVAGGYDASIQPSPAAATLVIR